ncbi:hypothetical protein DY000_02031970 [Brassica cretica]|uniref:Uncharacterized protein n=1 Tax=Brassica cretica TaxID=69181 RepID=A0ABQ7DWV7_BRACR|nr:hypothetical protein DY000_02031970 [Brassica cretica]
MRCRIERCGLVDDEGRVSVDGWVRESVDVKAAASSMWNVDLCGSCVPGEQDLLRIAGVFPCGF